MMISRRHATVAGLGAFAAALSSCSGGGGSPQALAPTRIAGSVLLTIPSATTETSSEQRRPQFISPSAASVSIAVTGVPAPVIANVAAGAPNCTAVAGGRSCSIPVAAPTGTVTFTVTLYDGANGKGKILGTGTATQTIASGTPFTVALGVSGVAGSIQIAAGQTAFVSGTKATTAITVTLKDSDGNTITGPYAAAITLTNSDKTGAFTLSTTTVASSSTKVTLSYNGSAAATNATISANAAGLPTSSISPATFTVAPANGYLYVADFGNATATVTAASATGDVAPLINLGGANTLISQNYGIAADPSGNIYLSNLRNPVITAYAGGATGNVAPLRTITGANTGLQGPLGLAIDAGGDLICSNFGAETVTVYAPSANGNATPIRTISGSNTALGNPYGIALDAAGKLYVVDNLSQFGGTDELTVYAAGANGNVAPLQNITGSNTGMSGATYVAVDSADRIYVTNDYAKSVTVYTAGATGNVAPIQTITGANTGIQNPGGIAVDTSGNIYVGDQTSSSILVFAPGANGNVAPIRTIGGTASGISGPLQIALGPKPPPAPTPAPTPALALFAGNDSSTSANGILEYNAVTGALYQTFATSIAGVDSLGIDNAGNVYTESPTTSQFAKVAIGGVNALATYNPTSAFPFVIAASSNGEVEISGFNSDGSAVFDVWDNGAVGSPTRSIIYSVGSNASGLGGSALGADGTLYVPYVGNPITSTTPGLNIDVYSPGATSPSKTIVDTLVPSSSVLLFTPNFVSVAPDGTVYIGEWNIGYADSGFTSDVNAGLYVYPPTGPQRLVTSMAPGIQGLDLDSAGNVYVASDNSAANLSGQFGPDTAHQFSVYSPGATSLIRQFDDGVPGIASLTVGDDGTAYAVPFLGSNSASGIYRIPAGSSTASVLVPTASTTNVVLYGNSVGKDIRPRGATFSASLHGPRGALIRKLLLKHRVL